MERLFVQDRLYLVKKRKKKTLSPNSLIAWNHVIFLLKQMPISMSREMPATALLRFPRNSFSIFITWNQAERVLTAFSTADLTVVALTMQTTLNLSFCLALSFQSARIRSLSHVHPTPIIAVITPFRMPLIWNIAHRSALPINLSGATPTRWRCSVTLLTVCGVCFGFGLRAVSDVHLLRKSIRPWMRWVLMHRGRCLVVGSV